MITLFTILISCLGLLGMAIYTAENRTKEIGIRKVLGATVSDILILLSKDYLKLIAIAVLIGGPASWFLNRLWLQNISNKIDFGIGVFIVGILGTAFLALLTILSQTLRAARSNSIQNLKSE
jgi:putative ABC transport system permease protein